MPGAEGGGRGGSPGARGSRGSQEFSAVQVDRARCSSFHFFFLPLSLKKKKTIMGFLSKVEKQGWKNEVRLLWK